MDVSGGTTGLTTSGGPITGSGTITLGGTLAITNGGTGAATASGARAALDVPSTGGAGATGTWGINISGSADSLTSNATINSVLVGYRNVPRTTTGTNIAAIGDVGKCISISANIQIPNSVFAAGDVVSIYNNSTGPLSITQGSGLSLIVAGTTNTGTRSIARNGMATIWFENSSTAIISGPGVA